MTDNNSLLQPGETLGPAAVAPTQSDSTHPLLQPGETLGDPVPSGHPIGDVIGKVSDVAGGVATGMAKGVGQTVTGISSLLHKIPGVGETLAPAAGIAPMEKATETHGTPEAIGSGIEGLAEFAAGDEAVTGLAKMAKIAKLAPEVFDILEKYPKTAKLFMGGAKGAAVGGGQGAVKGAAEGKAGEEATAGMVGGGVGGAVGETASEVAGALAKRFGVGTSAAEDAARGFKPAKRNYRFADDFQKAAPRIDAEAQVAKPQTLEDWADATDDARKKLWANEVQPLVDQYKAVPLDGDVIANNIRSKIPPAMTKYSPAEAAKIEALANQWTSGGGMGSRAMTVPAHNTFVGDAEEALEHYNALVAKTGYWSKTPSERAALLKSDGELAGNVAVADAIRDEFYNKLDTLEKARVAGQPTYPGQGVPAATAPARDIQKLKQEYGALRNVGNELRGQVNVQGRQSPVSLKEAIGLVTGLGRGGLTGGAMAAIPMVDRFANAPEKLVSRAVQKAARPGEEGVVSKAVTKGREAAGDVGAQVGAAIPRIYFQASDGSSHSVPADQIHEAMKIDPKLTIINQ